MYYETLRPNPVSLYIEPVLNSVPSDTLFIHGNLASGVWWGPAMQELTKTAPSAKGTAWLVDFHGCGKSSDPVESQPLNILEMAEDLNQMVIDVIRKPIHVVGHSTGGLLAALMMSLRPDWFRGGLLLDPVGAQGIAFAPPMLDAFAQMKQNQDLTAAVIGSTIHGLNSEDLFFTRKVIPAAQRCVGSVGLKVLQALDGVDFVRQLSNVKCPVMVVHGEFDQLLPVEESKKLAQLFSNGKFQIFKNQGHCGNIENPHGFAEILMNSFFR